MRTSLDLGDELLRRVKRRAADEGTSMRQIVETALQTYLAKRPHKSHYKFRWKTERGRLLPGVRLDDRDALFEVMDGRS